MDISEFLEPEAQTQTDARTQEEDDFGQYLVDGGAEIAGGSRSLRAEIGGKDETEARLIPNVISECALYTGRSTVCMSDGAIGKVGKSLGVSAAPEVILGAAKEKTGCKTERCVISRMGGVLGEDTVRHELGANFKIKGPRTSKLLSNVNIDKTQRQWTLKFKDFFPYNFNMRNYASYHYDDGYVIETPDTLATILFRDLYDGSYDGTHYRCCACVINSDNYQGDGKHWMALFADARGPKWTVEFFNSSGNAPAPEWVNWMEKTRTQMEQISDGKHEIEMVRATDVRHQNSMSECGVYSLFYIWARLNGIPPDYFKSTTIPDQIMFEFRQHLFDDEGFADMTKFDWGSYQKLVKVEWE